MTLRRAFAGEKVRRLNLCANYAPSGVPSWPDELVLMFDPVAGWKLIPFAPLHEWWDEHLE